MKILCKCGCGGLTSGKIDHGKVSKYIRGHNVRGSKRSYKARPKAKGRVAWNKGLKGRYAWHNTDGLKYGRGKHRRYVGLKGELSPSWRGGITPLRVKIWKHEKYVLWRTSIFERDDYRCQLCGARNGEGKTVKLNADHIKPWILILKENGIKTHEEALECKELWKKDNGRTLCWDCHKRTDTFSKRAYQYL